MPKVFARKPFVRKPFVVILSVLFVVMAVPDVSIAGLSGDPAIDLTLGTGYNIRAGGSGGAIDRSGQEWKCGTSGSHPFESKCPSDATYTPAAATGGSQSWGVGVVKMFLEDWEIECRVEWEFNPWAPWFIEPVVICEPVPTMVPAGTWGMAMAVLKWGEDNSATQAFSNEATSVLAFHESLLDNCNPIITPPDAVCFDQSDSSYVEDNGYEVDITISDPACTPPTILRVHGQSDYDNNCFTYFQYGQVSNLPAAYKDTTLGDSASVLSIGFGSAEGWAIDPGTTYIVRQFFSSKAQPNMIDTIGTHSGAISTRFDVPGLNCTVASPENCLFAVDTASVGGNSSVDIRARFSQVIL